MRKMNEKSKTLLLYTTSFYLLLGIIGFSLCVITLIFYHIKYLILDGMFSSTFFFHITMPCSILLIIFLIPFIKIKGYKRIRNHFQNWWEEPKY